MQGTSERGALCNCICCMSELALEATGPGPMSSFPYLMPMDSILALLCMHAKSFQLSLTICDSMDCNPPGSSIHEILQARILEWVAISCFRASSQVSNPRLLCLLRWQVGSLPVAPPGKFLCMWATKS